jgi:hypothetical protein
MYLPPHTYHEASAFRGGAGVAFNGFDELVYALGVRVVGHHLCVWMRRRIYTFMRKRIHAWCASLATTCVYVCGGGYIHVI